MKKLAWSIVFFFGLVACGMPTQHADTSRIIDKNDLLVVAPQGENLPPRLRPLIDAVGLILPVGCTATHIGDGLVLSAGHCFEDSSQGADMCKNTTVQFGLRAGVAPYLETRCIEVLAMELTEEKDFVLFRVADVPRAKVGIELRRNPKVGSRATILSHPRSRPLEWSQRCSISESRLLQTTLADFTHQCDTEPASSGAVLISTSSFKIVGIHNGGLEPWNYGTLIASTPNLLLSLRKHLPALQPAELAQAN